MKKPLTKEEFLDKRNSDLLREVKDALDLRSEIDASFKYIRDLERNSDIPSCPLYKKPINDMPKVGYSVLQIAMNISKLYFDGELVLRKKEFCENAPKAVLYFRDKDGNWYDKEMNRVDTDYETGLRKAKGERTSM